jgi:CRP/FNR family cyclic AMP-dependent transcriptional regulator
VEWELLEALSDDGRRALLARCPRRRFSKGEVVFHQGDSGDSLHLLAAGTAAVRVSTPMGEIVTLDILRSGEVFGEQALIADGSVRSATVVALEPCETMSLTRVVFEGLLAEHPGVALILVQVLEARLRATSQNLLEALYLSADARVFRRLARLAEIYTGHGSGAIPITQDDLATMAGTTRQTLNKVLRQAQDDGLVTLARGRISVIDTAGLLRRAR